MKRVLAIGDLETPPPRTVAPRPAQQVATGQDVLRGSSSSSAARWVQSGDRWFIRWRTGDTWFDLAGRYLRDGNRWREIFDSQDDAFHARVPKPVAIFTGALVAMPPEAVARARQLGEISSGGRVGPTPTPPTPSQPGGGVQPSPGPLAPPDVPPFVPPDVPDEPDEPQDEDHSVLTAVLILGALGLGTAVTVGVVAYRAAHEHERAEHGGRP
jgi:hypothetical protein